ncbi:MAG: alkaline phosphatase family protein [Nocardioidaceae bacterium]
MRKMLAAVAAASLIGLALASPGASTPVPEAVALDPITPRSPIENVVILYQENHSFDDTLGAVCNTRKTPCNGYTGPVRLANGRRVDNKVQPDISPFVLHTVEAQLLGMQNRWNRLAGCEAPKYLCITHVPQRRIPNLAALAHKFALSDASFASDPYAAFGMHIALAAGTVGGFTGRNPVDSRTGAEPGPGLGCPSRKDVRWSSRRDAPERYVPACIPDRQGQGPYRESPVPHMPTIMQRMEQAGKSWHIYQGNLRQRPSNGVWAMCTYFYWCEDNRFNLKHDSASRDFVAAARAGSLPNLSILLPIAGNSQHNHQSMMIGDNYIGRMVEAAMQGPDWDKTAIFIAYDDCGCFYDHVKPPAGLGLRQAVVMVSPWARRLYTDSTRAVQPYSMLAFLQHNFGLASLSAAVDRAYDYRRSFNFDKPVKALLPGIDMTTSRISQAKRDKLAQLPDRVLDPW